MDPVRILVVEDDTNHADLLAELLTREGYTVEIANTFDAARKSLEGRKRFDVVITDLALGSQRGTDVLRVAQELDPAPEVMLVSGVGTIEDAVESMHLGAVHYFTKPLDVAEIREEVRKAVNRIRERAPQAGSDATGFQGIIGRSAGMRKVYETIRRIAPSTATVLIQGENGTGKELVAKAIHNLSPRSSGPFVALNCAALSEGILESELFGHEKGAFTGAAQAREGKFEYANNGTLFLDEVGDMPLSLQVKLLRVIQEREIVRLGSNRSIDVDVRLIAATNKDLQKEIQAGNFREDLYYRLKVISLHLPPLRERADDIGLLASAFVKEFAERHQRPVTGIQREAVLGLEGHGWPGNVRELQNTIETMVLLATGSELSAADLPPEIGTAAPSRSTALAPLDSLPDLTLQELEKEMIKIHLERCAGNRAQVAKALGISERTLYRKLREYGL